ncbi:type IV secretory system conjugative DNA transfer family protein [Xanthobacter autotrophicus]|uniref:type IV secretory system conjugative DNA transfer family protein n=1 Tax=Xanthobacter autotrophicus TaxID=280 RepID=UPI00372BA012
MNPDIRRIVGITFDGRPIFEPKGTANSYILGAAGSGKTTSVTIPIVQSLLADTGRAIIINDVKNGEIAAQIAPLCARYGRCFGVIDEFAVLGANFPYRLSLNPFGPILGSHPHDRPFVVEAINRVLVEEPGDDAKNFFWRENQREVLDVVESTLHGRTSRLVFPGSAYALLNDPETWIAALTIEAEDGEPPLRGKARQLLDLRDNNPEHYSQHVRGALSALKAFGAEPLANAGRGAHLTHADLIRDHWVVCLVSPVRHAYRLGPFYALHLLAFMNAQLSGAIGRTDYILDEFCNAPLKEMLDRVTIQRGFGARSHFIAQSHQDVVRKYGQKEAALLEENCTVKQHLKFTRFEEAERVSKAMGEMVSVSRGLGISSEHLGISGNFSTGRERVFTPVELMQLPDDEQIVHVAGVGFIHCKKIRQNQIAPTCYHLGDNPLEGARLPPDPRVTLPTPKIRS